MPISMGLPYSAENRHGAYSYTLKNRNVSKKEKMDKTLMLLNTL